MDLHAGGHMAWAYQRDFCICILLLAFPTDPKVFLQCAQDEWDYSVAKMNGITVWPR